MNLGKLKKIVDFNIDALAVAECKQLFFDIWAISPNQKIALKLAEHSDIFFDKEDAKLAQRYKDLTTNPFRATV